MLTDSHFMAWFRQTPMGPLTQRDIDIAGDVRYVQPLLYFLCRGLKAQKIVEIGTADGSTTLPLLKAARETGGIVWSVDPVPCEDAKRLVSSFGYSDIWKFMQIKSDEFFSTYKDEIHFAFIDGDHSWVQVEKDINNCLSRLVEGGIVVLHDMALIDKSLVYDDRNPPARGNYEVECQYGVNKALQLLLPKYPDVDFLPIHFVLGVKDPDSLLKIVQDWPGGGLAILRKRYNYEGCLNPKR